MNVLICTNGTAWGNRALEVGKQIALAAARAVDILVTARHAEQLEEAVKAAEAAAIALQAEGITVTINQRSGRLARETIRQAHAASYDLVVIGSRGRRGTKRLLLGSVAATVTQQAPASVLVIKGRKRTLKRFLVCSAAGPASEQTVRFAGKLAQAVGASVTLIHVMSQLPATQKANMADLEAPADELIQRCSREGVHLTQMLALLAAEGPEARAVVRHGLVVDEIIAEAREGRFDLLVVGFHITPGIRPRLVDDLCERTLQAADIPVLVVRQAEREL
jgi:nucleotide-binding universal stress UspA family protein